MSTHSQHNPYNQLGDSRDQQRRELEIITKHLAIFLAAKPIVMLGDPPKHLAALDGAHVTLADSNGNVLGRWPTHATSIALESILDARHIPYGTQRIETIHANNAVHLAAGEGDIFGYLQGPILSLGGTLIKADNDQALPIYPHTIDIIPSPVHIANYERLLRHSGSSWTPAMVQADASPELSKLRTVLAASSPPKMPKLIIEKPSKADKSMKAQLVQAIAPTVTIRAAPRRTAATIVRLPGVPAK